MIYCFFLSVINSEVSLSGIQRRYVQYDLQNPNAIDYHAQFYYNQYICFEESSRRKIVWCKCKFAIFLYEYNST